MPRLKAPQRREQLLAVATKLFARWGFNATTTAAIADAAGVTEPILYRHFKSKQELFVAITRRTSDETVAHWKELIGGVADPGEKILLIAREFPEHRARIEDAYHVIHGALATSRDRMVVAVLRQHYTRMHDFFLNIILDGQQRGRFNPHADASIAAWQIMFTGIGQTMISMNLTEMPCATAEQAIDCIVHSLKNPEEESDKAKKR